MCCNSSRNGGQKDKREWCRGWIQLWYIVRTFVNSTTYPQYNNNKISEFIKWLDLFLHLLFHWNSFYCCFYVLVPYCFCYYDSIVQFEVLYWDISIIAYCSRLLWLFWVFCDSIWILELIALYL
jgi:hypothetical protein